MQATLIPCRSNFFYLIDKGFCPVHEFLGFFSADLKVKTERIRLHALMLSPSVIGSEFKTFPAYLFLKPPVFTYIVLKKYFYSLNSEPF